MKRINCVGDSLLRDYDDDIPADENKIGMWNRNFSTIRQMHLKRPEITPMHPFSKITQVQHERSIRLPHP